MRRILGIMTLATVLVGAGFGDVWSRGFGGGRVGGFSGGGFHDFGGGGYAGGNYQAFRGGYSGGYAPAFRGGGVPDYRGGDWNRYRPDGGQAYRPDLDRRIPDDSWRPRADSDRDPISDQRPVSRDQLDRFLGMPEDAGLSHVTPGGWDASHVAAGVVKGPFGEAAFVKGTNVRYIPPEDRINRGQAVRNEFNRYDIFTPAWYRNHPAAWVAADLARAAWSSPTWADVSDWLGCDSDPVDYDYGNSVVYQDGNVCVDGDQAGTAAQYYDQAASLASAGSSTQGDQSQWMSLGVFGLVQGDGTNPTMMLQLAVNPQGVIGGNCFDTVTNTTLPVRGSVDKSTQRAAWTIGDNKGTVIDTGLDSLTKDQAPVLVHFGSDNTQEWLMVRLQSKTEAGGDS